MWIYLNDKFVSEEEAKVSVFDYGFLYGDGLFETFRVYSGKIFALDQHLERLSSSADRLQLEIPPVAILKNLLDETIKRNLLKEAIVRLTVTRGRGKSGLHPESCIKRTLVITARSFEGYSDQYRRGVSCAIVSVHRVSSLEKEGCLKSLSFLDNILARLDANRRNFFEGIFLNMDGYLSEGTISNIFWARNHVLSTPSISAPILNGITRQTLLGLARKNKIPIEEGLYPPEDLLDADEAFLTNTAFEVMPLTRVNDIEIGSGQPGPITRKLHRMFQDAVKAGED